MEAVSLTHLPRGGDMTRYPWLGGWLVPRAGLDAVANREISCPYRELNPDSSVAQPVG
jgi:hypothetical protein